MVGTTHDVVELTVPAFRHWISLGLVRNTRLAVSVHDPDGLIAALTDPAG